MSSNPYLTEQLISLARQNHQRSAAFESTDLRDIPFSPVEHYGYEHSQEMSTVAHYIAEGLGVTGLDLQAVKIAGLFHDLGREQPWQRADPDHQRRSADMAVTFLKGQGETWAKAELIEQVAWLIANHSLAGPLPSDPRLQALWDADAYDAARFSPGTPEGMRIFRERTARLCTDWAKNPENKRTWLKHRGW